MGLVAPLRATDVDFIDIHFRGSLFDVTYNIYGKRINSIWLCGTIVSTDYEKGLFTFDDDSGRILQIKFTTTIFYSQQLDKNTIEIGRLVSILCGISHVIVEEDALLCLKLMRITHLTHLDMRYWPLKIKHWRIDMNE